MESCILHKQKLLEIIERVLYIYIYIYIYNRAIALMS